MPLLDRRHFLKLALASTAAAACESPGTSSSKRVSAGASSGTSNPSTSSGSSGSGEGAADEAPSKLSNTDLRTRTIPGTDEALPVVGLGTWQQFDVSAGSSQYDQLRTVLDRMATMGGQVVDSSPMYGRAESIVGRLLDEMGRRDDFFLATKVWTSGRQAGIRQMNQSFEKFRADTIDLMQVHNLLDWQTHLETLKKWKNQGRVRYIGVTHYTSSALPRLVDVIESEPVDFVQFAYSIETRAPENELLAAAEANDVATLVNRPFEGGSLFGRAKGHDLPDWAAAIGIDSWAQYFLKFLLADERVTCVIPGTSDPEHVVDNLGAATGPLPDTAQRKKMARHWRNL